jgi:hypothetical protein
MKNIKEMRSSLNAQFSVTGGIPDTAPDWVVRGIFEKVNGLPLTPLPAGLRAITKSDAEFRSWLMQSKSVPAKTEVSAAEREAAQRRVLLASISLLQ